MTRRLYVALLRLYPALFRQRFGTEMLESFDAAVTTGLLSRARLLFDVFVSLVRHWGLRPAPTCVREVAPPRTFRQANLAPTFYQFDEYHLRYTAIIYGCVVSIALFAFISICLGRTQALPLVPIIGASARGEWRFFSFDRMSLTPAEPTTRVVVREYQPTTLEVFAAKYFHAVLVLDALDADKDYQLSAHEIATASASLLLLDRNRDGRLSAEEAGAGTAPRMGPSLNARIRRDYMDANPVLRILDQDADTVISPDEIKAAPSSLLKLDVAHVGFLGTIVLVPDPIARKILLPVR